MVTIREEGRRLVLEGIKDRGFNIGAIIRDQGNIDYQIVGMINYGIYEYNPHIVVIYKKPNLNLKGYIDIKNLGNYKKVGYEQLSKECRKENESFIETYQRVINYSEIEERTRVGSLINFLRYNYEYELIVSENPTMVYNYTGNSIPTEEEMKQELIRNCNISRLKEIGKEFYAHIDTKLVKQYNEKEIKKIVTKLSILQNG